MKNSVEHFRKSLGKLRSGRANINVFEDIRVDYYGSKTPINQVATLGIPDPTLITIKPYEINMLEEIEKAVRAADLGFNPINDGKILKIPVPPLDEERRREIAKHIGRMLEEEKTAIRNMRRESKEMIEMMEKEKEISEDDKYWGLDKLQEITDEHIKEIEKIAEAKEKEILQL
ncbi:MAG: ribosome recycling factor [Candidatus Aminicenantaceae bacterium]